MCALHSNTRPLSWAILDYLFLATEAVELTAVHYTFYHEVTQHSSHIVMATNVRSTACPAACTRGHGPGPFCQNQNCSRIRYSITKPGTPSSQGIGFWDGPGFWSARLYYYFGRDFSKTQWTAASHGRNSRWALSSRKQVDPQYQLTEPQQGSQSSSRGNEGVLVYNRMAWIRSYLSRLVLLFSAMPPFGCSYATYKRNLLSTWSK